MNFSTQRGVHILTATPGRLNDFVEKGIVTFSSVKFFVLDEADRMLDMGFKPVIEQVLTNSTMTSIVSLLCYSLHMYCVCIVIFELHCRYFS